MKKMFTIERKGTLWIDEEGHVYSFYNHSEKKWHFYNYSGEELVDYHRVKKNETPVKHAVKNGLTYNKYGVACDEDFLVDLEGNEIPDTKLNCVESCTEDDRYFSFALLNDNQCSSIEQCGTAPEILLDIYDTKTRKYVIKGIPENKLDVSFFDGEPEVLLEAAKLINEYDSIEVRKSGSIIARKDCFITLYDYYQK